MEFAIITAMTVKTIDVAADVVAADVVAADVVDVDVVLVVIIAEITGRLTGTETTTCVKSIRPVLTSVQVFETDTTPLPGRCVLNATGTSTNA